MFKKLVANLPFNPSLINQVGFYADRLKQEKALRRLSFVFMALLMVVQIVAVISPPEKSLAASSGHIMDGLQTKQDILSYYDNRNGNIKALFTHYNISRTDIANLTNAPNATIRTNDGNDWWTVGKTSLYSRPDVANIYKRNQRQIEYKPNAYVYERQLKAFDIINPYNTYAAWRGTSSTTGQTFWIIKSCGNITWIGDWKEPAPEPKPEPKPKPSPELRVEKSIDRDGPLNPGDEFTYRLEYGNTKIGSQAARDVAITDQLDAKNLVFLSHKKYINASGFLNYPIGDLPASKNLKLLEIRVRLKDPIPNGEKVCNQASINGSNAAKDTSERICVKVITPCVFNPEINSNNKNCVEPVVRCDLLKSAIDFNKRSVNYKTKVYSSNKELVSVKSYEYDFGNGKTQTVVSDQFMNNIEHTYELGEYRAKVVVKFVAPTESGQTEQTTDCEKSIEFEEKPLSKEKTVEIVTQGIKGEDALEGGVKLQAGDIIEYTLTTVNSNAYEITEVEVSDDITDLLDYTDINLEFLANSNGEFIDEDNKVIWKSISIPARSKVEMKFQVTVKDPVPATNNPSIQGNDFDCKIFNSYGNDVSLDVACPVVKSIETIPNTGPGTSLLLITTVTAIVGYFYARARLFSKEIELIRTDYSVSGGM